MREATFADLQKLRGEGSESAKNLVLMERDLFRLLKQADVGRAAEVLGNQLMLDSFYRNKYAERLPCRLCGEPDSLRRTLIECSLTQDARQWAADCFGLVAPSQEEILKEPGVLETYLLALVPILFPILLDRRKTGTW